MKTISCFLFTSLILLFTSCKPTETNIDPDPSKPETGYVTGQAVNNQGQPLAGAKITLNSTYYNAWATARTDAQGRYRIKMSDAPASGSWYIRGTADFAYNQGTYSLALFTEADSEFGGEGAVKNLQLKLTGSRNANQGYYGGKITVSPPSSGDFYDSANAEITLEPAGPLVDGSPGQTIRTKPDYLYIHDVPVGRYKITAKYLPTGQPMGIRVRNQGTFGPSVTTMFDPGHAGSVHYKLELEVKPQ